ncbi:MAG: radical SAM protein [Bacteroidales bacterium]|nr:radical SAM protein [Bacteroidales bacterium]
MERRIFGPVPSRRLGKSLGVNNIPHKICTYSCLYCQVGKAIKMQVNRQDFYKPEDLFNEVRMILGKIQNENEYPDYITIVPDGEPTLDINLGKLIMMLKTTGVPVAVITNGSLINFPDVKEDLMKADFLSIKADTFNIEKWRKINKPHKKLSLDAIIEGARLFSYEYTGKLVTETMLLKGINNTVDDLENTARVIASFKPDTAYIAIPTRPPAYKETIPANESDVNRAYHIFSQHIQKVELLTGYEGNTFSSTGSFREDILSITAVHPMREDAVRELLSKTNEEYSILTGLIEDNLIERLNYTGSTYYLRKFKK